MMTSLRYAPLLYALAALIGGPALAADAPGTTPPILWSRQCAKEGNGPEICYVEQYAVAMPGNTVLLNVVIGFMGPGGAARMIITAPLGVRLIPGLIMTVDTDKPLTLPFESCNTGGCRMIVDLDSASFERIRRGGKMTVRFVAADRGAVDIPVPLAGLTAALKQLKP